LLLVAAGSSTISAATAPTITTQPANETVKSGASATFAVVASGTAPLSYQWYSSWNGLISGATASKYTVAANNGDNGEFFYVIVKNSAGSVESNWAYLAVVTPPVIYNQPSSVTVTEPGIAYFEVDAYDSDYSTNDLTYQWYKNGAVIAGATSYVYTKAETTTADNGAKFAAKVTNSAGSVTSTLATLTVNAATAGTLPITGAWSGTVTVVDPVQGTSIQQVVATFSQTSYSVTGTFVATDDNGIPTYGAGIASLNGNNVYTSATDDDGGPMNIAAGFTTNLLTLNGSAVGSDGSGGAGQINISADHNTLTGSAKVSDGTKLSWTLTREK